MAPDPLPASENPRRARSHAACLRLVGPPEREGSRATATEWLWVLTTTVLVAGLPVALVFWLRASGTVASPILAVVLGMSLSFGTSQIGRTVWEKRPACEDLLFSDLMLWGFLHRRYSQRRLESARDTLGPIGGLHGADPRHQAGVLERLVARIETRDRYLHNHSRRVARYSWMVAKAMGLSRSEVARIRTAAALHDVGKIRTPKAILHKAGRLTREEYEIVKRHPADGATMVTVLRDGELESIIRHHHERIDGTGYPDRLRADAIPLGARIIAVADTFDAITSARPYRGASPHRKALDILKVEAGTQLDHDVVHTFCRVYGGRRPIALWTMLTGLPERVAGWLAAGAGGVASVAKTAAAAVLIGGGAAATSAVAIPIPAHPSPAPRAASARSAAPAPRPSRSGRLAGQQNAASALGLARARRSAAKARSMVPASKPTSRGPQGQTPTEPSSHLGESGDRVATGSLEGPGTKPEGSRGKPEGSQVKPEGGPQRKPEEPRAKPEEPRAKPEEPRAKPEEAHAKPEPQAKPEEAHGKSEEPHGKPEEAHAKPEPQARPEEAHGKSEEPHGKPS